MFLALTWTLAIVLDRPVVQPIFNEQFLKGRGMSSYPMWGYSLFIGLLGGVGHVVAFQSVLGACAAALLLVRLKEAADSRFSRRALNLLFLAALPWWSFMAYAYQMPLSSSWVILGLLALDKAVAGSRGMALAAGVWFGIGQNLRSELLLLPGLIVVAAWAATRMRLAAVPRLRPLLVCAVTALTLQLPWALFNLRHEGRFTLSESNLGHVLYFGLSQIEPNPWKVIPTDTYMKETVTRAGIQASSLSFEGGRYLKSLFLEGVRQHPAAYLRVLLSRVWATACSPPFGHVDIKLTPEENDLVRRVVVGIRGGGQEPAASPPGPGNAGLGLGGKVRVAGGIVYDLLQGLLSRVVSVLGLVGLVLAWRKGVFRLADPLVLFLAVAIVARVAMNIAFHAAGKYMTSVYLCYLPFAVNSLVWGQGLLAARFGAAGRRGGDTG